ncbi:MAG: LysE family translocator [Alphaproteobacteria bacterium HGW-Alphaproteobacteria-6]|nr:MAG: LysE family translocator [Alphaproteobacteria bacterium HGW-Alphaproteobacteria-6]
MMWDLIAAFPAGHLATFILGGLVVNVAPGADMMFATACGLQGGPRSGMLAGFGAGLGVLWHIMLAALGLSVLIAAHPGALATIRWAGAAYLLWLASKAWRAAAEGPATVRPAIRPARVVARGFLTNALNPKPIFFFLAFLPQFTSPAFGPIWQQVVALGAIFALTGTLVTMGYGALAGLMGRSLGRRLGALNRIAAVVFAGLAARLVIE